jgi:hypothetical protein
MADESPRVEFDREVLRPVLDGAGEDANGDIDLSPALGLWRSVRLVRWVAMTAGAAVIAYLTHRSGLSLDGALCVFMGLLPILWIMGWFAGLSFGARRVATVVRASGPTASPAQLLARIPRHSQHVALSVATDALEVTLRDAEASQSHRWPWREVQLIRQDQDAFWLHREHDSIEVPRTAFADGQAFEAFALAAQARIWAAMR